MKITLTISERINCITMINAFKGKLSEMAILLEDVKLMNLTEKETKDINLIEKKDEDGTISGYQWDEDKVEGKEMKLQSVTKDYLINYISDRDEAGEYTLADVQIIALRDKLQV